MRSLKICLLALVLMTGKANAEANNVYSNHTVGFNITKPSSWFFASEEDNQKTQAEIMKQYKVSDEAFKRYAQGPIVTLTKYPKPYSGLNPEIKVSVRPLNEFSANNPVGILNVAIPGMSKAVKSFKVLEGPKETTVDGMKAAYMTTEVAANIGGKKLLSYSQIWVIPRGKMFFRITTSISPEEKNTSKKEMAAILATIKITK